MKQSKNGLLLVALMILSLSFSVEVSAQGCKSAPSIISDLLSNYGKQLAKLGCSLANQNGCLDDVTKYAQLTKEQINYWNSKSGTTAWATIGPRRLDFGETYTGKLVSTGGRMFISAVASNKSSMTVTINELDGKGKTSVVVCKIDKNGTYIPLATKWFNDTSERKDKKDEKRSFTISGVKGHLISINFDGKSVGNTFQYKLSVK